MEKQRDKVCGADIVNGGLEMPNYDGIKVLKPINTCLFFS
jgi:hypothetical protein